ncbi:hypothetical protein MHU86_118 [Fragilaria crotonensis]|nr:hypothetical protein MHU86_118 [Fragilaria crotonensis]
MQLTRRPKHIASAAQDKFSSQVQLALSALSSRFGGEINGAFETMPATEERAKEDIALKEDPDAAMNKLKILQDNKLSITQDMRILHQAKVLGNTAQFQAFLYLGKEDYLDDDEASDYESEDESDDDSCSDDESESESDDESDSSDFDDSDYDSDDSSLGSVDDLMNEMEEEMGVVIPEDLKVKVVKSKGLTSVLRGKLYWDDSDATLVSMGS